ncbi:hypothetical protein COY95_05200, partial [Candidatus Woesearchaeota archaeon CG_4_10_14_0_8_um_filter_47_5]
MNALKAAQASYLTLLLLFLISLFFALALAQQGIKTLNPEAESIKEVTDFQDVSAYTREIMNSASLYCFELMGEQGGRIFTDQGGYTPRYGPPYYGIENGVEGKSYYPADVPTHVNGLLMDSGRPREEFNFGKKYVYGFPAPLPPLDKEQFDGTGYVDESIERQLAGCIQHYFRERIDYSVFEQRGIDIVDVKEWDTLFSDPAALRAFLASADASFDLNALLPSGGTEKLSEYFPIVDVTVAEDDVQVTLIYPVVATLGKTKRLLSAWNILYLDFALRRMYTYIYNQIIPRDEYFLRFYDISMDLVKIELPEDAVDRNGVPFRERFVLERREGDDATYDIVNVKDNGFLIEGVPFRFIFARENRPPDLNTVTFYKGSLADKEETTYIHYAD